MTFIVHIHRETQFSRVSHLAMENDNLGWGRNGRGVNILKWEKRALSKFLFSAVCPASFRRLMQNRLTFLVIPRFILWKKRSSKLEGDIRSLQITKSLSNWTSEQLFWFLVSMTCWRRFRSAYLLTAFRHAYRKYIDREQLFLSGWFEKLGISKKVKGSSGNLNPWIHLLDDEGESFLQELSPVQAFLLIEWTMSKIPFDCSTAPDAGNR